MTTTTGLPLCPCGKPATHLSAPEDSKDWGCRVPNFDPQTGRIIPPKEITAMTAALTARPFPPLTECPSWCIYPAGHQWDRDGDEFARDHDSDNLASPGARYTLRLYRIDNWHDGILEIRDAIPVLVLDDECIDRPSADLLAADYTAAHAKLIAG